MAYRWGPTWLVLLLSLGFGLAAGYAALQLLGRQPAELPGPQFRIEAIAADVGGYRVTLDHGLVLKVDTGDAPFNSRNMALLYPGKTVAVVSEGDPSVWSGGRRPCRRIVPLLQEGPPLLTLERYRVLTDAGFSDAEIAVSYAIPKGSSNQNRPPSPPGSALYARLSLCAREPE